MPRRQKTDGISLSKNSFSRITIGRTYPQFSDNYLSSRASFFQCPTCNKSWLLIEGSSPRSKIGGIVYIRQHSLLGQSETDLVDCELCSSLRTKYEASRSTILSNLLEPTLSTSDLLNWTQEACKSLIRFMTRLLQSAEQKNVNEIVRRSSKRLTTKSRSTVGTSR